jgi:cytoskeletal protein CcmA (bactofilin family)
MSMFSRTDKMHDSYAVGAAQREKGEPPTPTAVEAARQPAAPQGRTLSVISKSLKITGELRSTEDIQVDGEVDGDVRGAIVKIGSNARIKGTVYAQEVELAGTIDGKIEAKKVVLTGTAHMSGDIIHQEIRIELGAFIDGYCRPEYGKATNKNAAPFLKPVAAAPEQVAAMKGSSSPNA